MAELDTYFQELCQKLGERLEGEEVLLANLQAERSDFCRFNHAQVRQAGHVHQCSVSLDLIEGKRHAQADATLSEDLALDVPRLTETLLALRARRAATPEDPYLLYQTEPRSTDHRRAAELPDPGEAVATVQDAAAGRDLVGIYAAGPIQRGFWSSLGQMNWHESESFHLDWSFYHRADKAVKESYAGFDWSEAAFRQKVALAAEKLAVLEHPSRTVPAGRYRVYLAPAAVDDIIGTMAWGGFGLKAHRTKQTPLIKMLTEGATLSPEFTLTENTKEGVAPGFQSSGFLKPDRVTLIEGGVYKDCLISPRSAAEYGVETNGASGHESPESGDLAAGSLATERILAELDRGVYIGNVWYLNWSDRTACRTTGMTRFATFWVEDGKIQAPLDVMRFDETAYRMLGENLRGFTRERELCLSAGTYFGRSTGSTRVPGALVDDFTFTL